MTQKPKATVSQTWNVSRLVKAIAKTGNHIAELERDIKKLQELSDNLTQRLRRIMKVDK